MYSAREYLQEKCVWWLEERKCAPDEAQPVLAPLGRILRGHLARLAYPLEDVASKVNEQVSRIDFDRDLAREQIDAAAREFADLTATLDEGGCGHEETATLARSVFHHILDVLVLAVDGGDEELDTASWNLYGTVIDDRFALVAAGPNAAAFDEAYVPGTDLPRLFCRAVARAAARTADPNWSPLHDMNDLPQPRPLSMIIAEADFSRRRNLAAGGGASTGVDLADLRQVLEGHWWYIDDESMPCLELGVDVLASSLWLMVHEHEDEIEDVPSRQMDGWRICVRTRAEVGEPMMAEVRAGRAEFKLHGRIEPGAFLITVLPPQEMKPVECYGVPKGDL